MIHGKGDEDIIKYLVTCLMAKGSMKVRLSATLNPFCNSSYFKNQNYLKYCNKAWRVVRGCGGHPGI